MATGSEQAVVRHASLYRRLLWLYPASFRNEYRHAMVQLFCDQFRDQARDRPRKAAARVWLRAFRDLATSVPNQRIEVFMSEQQTSTQLVTVAAAIWLSIVAVLFVGLYAGAVLIVAAGWVVYQWRRGRYVQVPGGSRGRGWIVAGAAIVAVALLPAVLSMDELSEWAWSGFALLTVTGLIAIAVGATMEMRDRDKGPVTPA